MNLKRKPLFVSLLLDETGSMQSIKDDTIRAYNKYLEGLKESKSGSDIRFSLVTFNSSRTQTRVVAEKVQGVGPLTVENYQPAAMTPLIDAAVKVIRATDEAVAARGDSPDVVVVIQTDGQENCSVEYDAGDLALLVKEKEQAGWQFVFLGAGLDAFDAARHAGLQLNEDVVMSYGREHSEEAMNILAAKVRDYDELRNPMALAFNVGDRQKAGDRWHKAKPADPDPADPKPTQKRDRRSSAGDIKLT
jgi:hypothetical protein